MSNSSSELKDSSATSQREAPPPPIGSLPAGNTPMMSRRSADSSGGSSEIRPSYSLDSSDGDERVMQRVSVRSELGGNSMRSSRSTGSIDNISGSDDDCEYDTEDDELRVAKELALAISNNPNLTAAELKELQEQVAKRPSGSSRSKKSRRSPFKKAAHKLKSGGKKVTGVLLKNITPERRIAQTSSERSSSLMFSSFRDGRGSPSVEVGGALSPPSSSSGRHRFASDFTDEDHAGLPNLQQSPGIRMTGIVWKRRSGLGKYSASAAWERRRVVLKGNKLVYYQTGEDVQDEADAASDPPPMVDASPRVNSESGGAPARAKSWLLDPAGMISGVKAEPSPDAKGARGYLDLIKDNCSIGASFGHSGAPTPFSLSIKVLTQTKWKLCFDTHAELMEWLCAMTDVIVQGSVDSYNSQILQAHDPQMGDGTYPGQLSEPPLLASIPAKESAGGHRLWVGGQYQIQSEGYSSALLGALPEQNELDIDGDEGFMSEKGLPASSSLERKVYVIPSTNIWYLVAMLNLAVILARASTTTVENFWYLIVFVNISLLLGLSKEKVGGAAVTRALSSTALGLSAVPKRTTISPKKKVSPAAPASVIKPDGYKPDAGSTTMRIKNPTDLPVNKDGHVFAGWRIQDPTMMKIRSHGYMQTKVKVPSPGELYECVHADIFESRTRFPDMASRVHLPNVEFTDDGPKTWNCPDTFVISIAIPTDPPKLYSSKEDGGGYTVTIYYKMHKETREILKRVTADGYNAASEQYDDIQKTKVNAIRLLEEWCRRAPTDDAFAARFKVLPNAQNLKEIGLPAWIAKYNGKPFLIKRPGQTGFLYKHPDKSCIEFDISLHPFPYLAKQGICFMKDVYFRKVLVTFGFLIEGRSDDELPECLIGLMQLCYPDPIHAIQGEDFLAGKSPKSFV